MGFDGAELKKRNAKNMQKEHAPSEDPQTLKKKKSLIDKLRPFIFAIVVPVLVIMIINEYASDDINTKTSVSSQNYSSTTASSNSTSNSDFAETAVILLNIQFEGVCTAEITGFFSKTLKIDWTANTNKLNAMTVFGSVGNVKAALYEDGVRYFQFPNDSGTYNVIDWKTGDKKTISDRAKYYFN